MVGWAAKREEDICLSCHRTLLFTYRVEEDGRVEGIAPTVLIDRERDARDPALSWVTLQLRCLCGVRAGRMIEVRASGVAGTAPPPG